MIGAGLDAPTIPAHYIDGPYSDGLCSFPHDPVPMKTRLAPEAMLPLTPLSFHILLALADDDRHGYGIIKEVRERTNGEMNPGAGTLYAAVQRMLDSGMIDETQDRPAVGDDERRRY